MKFAVTFTPPRHQRVVALAQAAERSGFSWFGLGDSQSVFREVYVSLTAAALSTSRIDVGPVVTNLVTRHVAVTASTLATLSEVADGRLKVGIGTGDSALLNIGERPMKRDRFKESFVTLRSLLDGETVALNDREMHVQWANGGVPLYMSAEGPRAFELAGQYADGAIVGSGLTPNAVDWALSHLEMGARSVGRKLADLDIWFFAKGSLNADSGRAVDDILGTLAASANHAFRFKASGDSVSPIPPELMEPVRELQRGYQTRFHAKTGRSPNADLVEHLGLTDYLAKRFAIAGTKADVSAQIKNLRGLGVENVLLTGINSDPLGFVHDFGSVIATETGEAS